MSNNPAKYEVLSNYTILAFNRGLKWRISAVIVECQFNGPNRNYSIKTR